MALALLDEDALIDVKDSELGLDGGDDATVYTLRVVTPQVIRKLRKQHTVKRPSGGQGMVEQINTDTFGEALFDYVLQAWRGVVFRGVPVGADDMIATSTGNVKAKTQLDGSRKAALLEREGANEVVDTDASFRRPA
jgi:hypothetical protein